MLSDTRPQISGRSGQGWRQASGHAAHSSTLLQSTTTACCEVRSIRCTRCTASSQHLGSNAVRMAQAATVFANVRKYPSTLDAALDVLLRIADRDSTTNLIDAVHRSFAPCTICCAEKEAARRGRAAHAATCMYAGRGRRGNEIHVRGQEIALKALAPLGGPPESIMKALQTVGSTRVLPRNGASARARTRQVRAYTRMCCSTSRARSTTCSRSCMRWALHPLVPVNKTSRPHTRITLSLLLRTSTTTRPC